MVKNKLLFAKFLLVLFVGSNMPVKAAWDFFAAWKTVKETVLKLAQELENERIKQEKDRLDATNVAKDKESLELAKKLEQEQEQEQERKDALARDEEYVIGLQEQEVPVVVVQDNGAVVELVAPEVQVNYQVDVCPICLKDINDDQIAQDGKTGGAIKTLGCGHKFHINCINSWFDRLEYNNQELTCPLCRAVLTRDGRRVL